jgi:hypothetical protein
MGHPGCFMPSKNDRAAHIDWPEMTAERSVHSSRWKSLWRSSNRSTPIDHQDKRVPSPPDGGGPARMGAEVPLSGISVSHGDMVGMVRMAGGMVVRARSDTAGATTRLEGAIR